ncbi:histone-lysine N-methyltransferase, H3 lysine-36 specific-like [Actinia tenebrosa]|uniref:Histone-lysine N-methyltransferase, H3 lysine-36 specific-like n=1 Tax=Actinia tenebrosa TaxID=6105 RepID=A0A6P8H9R1_ACTTE|nr:histone-lysine N-methyltransferase, H3 lysine-36 specific-like [Actinia tenebrosa]
MSYERVGAQDLYLRYGVGQHTEREPFFQAPGVAPRAPRTTSTAERAADRFLMNTPVLPPLSPLPPSPTHDYDADMLQLLGSPFNLPDDMVSVLSSDTPLSTGSDLARAMDPPSPEPSPGPSPERSPGVSPTFSPSTSPAASPPSEVANLAAWTPDSGRRLTSLPDATLDQMNKEELREYAEALKSLAEKYPQVKDTLTPTIKNVMTRVDGRWRGNRSEKRMNLAEVEEYVKELEATDQSKFDETSQMRIRYALEKALARRLQLRKEAEQDRRRNGGDDPEGDDGDGGDGGGDDDDDDDANDDHGERFKNADQDTVSKALRKKLGKGDHQTIANTTTVTTVRRGKRPVVEREHTSQTFPGPGSDNDDDDDDGGGGDDATIEGGVLRRKRKSRVSKSKPRRKKHSQRGGIVAEEGYKTPHESVCLVGVRGSYGT